MDLLFWFTIILTGCLIYEMYKLKKKYQLKEKEIELEKKKIELEMIKCQNQKV
ncbi:hypothetical protein LC087_17135 [Bacillus carboniphilus]|uniref:Uncharacterized protein n=1 Tax=Bacillus carboniphilus TaxID=86663 RepID=A0ABY9JVG1_9BACI|nr:hypothetical protein [Bacillus carboniphilus]WLR42405.1 hypothetical protein LC087_17135 [Bacillus carboniphilus]